MHAHNPPTTRQCDTMHTPLPINLVQLGLNYIVRLQMRNQRISETTRLQSSARALINRRAPKSYRSARASIFSACACHTARSKIPNSNSYMKPSWHVYKIQSHHMRRNIRFETGLPLPVFFLAFLIQLLL